MIHKTPGVYVKDQTPPQVVDPLIETALPVFIGYTEKARYADGGNLTGIPHRVSNLEEFHFYFGGEYRPEIYQVTARIDGAPDISVEHVHIPVRFFLYEALQHFYENGGRDCLIVSVGSYTDQVALEGDLLTGAIGLRAGLEAAGLHDDPTLLLFPDAVTLTRDSVQPDFHAIGQLQAEALQQCARLQDRFLIADLVDAGEMDAIVAGFRERIGLANLKYGAAYFPWVYSHFDHAFHFRQIQFGTNTSGNFELLTNLSILSSSADSPEGQQQRELVHAVRRLIDGINLMANALGSDFDRKKLTEFKSRFAGKWESLARATDTAEIQAGFSQLLQLLQRTALAFLHLDGSLAPVLQSRLTSVRRTHRVPDVIEAWIGFEKRAAVLALIDSGRQVADVNADYQTLSSSWWIRSEKVEDIDPEPDASPLDMAALIDALAARAWPLIDAYADLYEAGNAAEEQAEQILFEQHPFLGAAAAAIALELKKIPPSGAVAGIYAETDASRGVWKAPANVAIRASLGPVLPIDDRKQEALNVHTTGKSINAIRSFRGRGIRIWGARTLAGNDLEWRYVPVRRFFIYVEKFVRKAVEPYVFESNDANTWIQVRLLLDNFLTAQWRKGALAGATTTEAYYVKVGLGESMTAEDLLEGRLIVEIGLAAARPAEFIVIRYTCHLEES